MSNKEKTIKVISSVFLGVGAGLIMGAVVLFMINWTGLALGAFAWVSVAVISCALPACFDVVQRSGLTPMITEGAMILTSFIVCLLYHNAIMISAGNSTLMDRLFIIHGISFILNGVRLYFTRRK